jgi:methylmalonyl-CoA mutase
MSELNFDEFASASMHDWQRLVTKELGDKPFEGLIWILDDGIAVDPCAAESSQTYAMDIPAQWEMVQRILGDDAKQWNDRALASLMGGCNSLIMPQAPNTQEEFQSMLDGVFLQYIHLHIEQSSDALKTANMLRQWCSLHSVNSKELRGSLGADGLKCSADEFKSLSVFMKENFGFFRVFTVNVRSVHEEGGSVVQEIAAALAEGHALIVRCMDAGLTVDEASALIQFNFATGSSYFAEIAKYRAFRWAWKSIIEQYKPAFGCSINTHIQASTSRFLQTAKDVHNNLLRATTQAMSAVVGGVNGLVVEPYNSLSTSADDAALRWSRNIQQLLTEESYFEQFRAAANGAHYIESLTHQILQTSWSRFQQWDALCASQGVMAYAEERASAVQLHAQREQEKVKDGRRIVVGVNKYVNKADASVVEQSARTLTASLEQP